MAKLVLDGAALQKLRVVENEKVDRAQRLLEGDRGLRAQSGDKAVHEALGGEINRASALAGRRMRHGLQQMGLAEPDRGVNVKRAESRRLALSGLDDFLRRRIG